MAFKMSLMFIAQDILICEQYWEGNLRKRVRVEVASSFTPAVYNIKLTSAILCHSIIYSWSINTENFSKYDFFVTSFFFYNEITRSKKVQRMWFHFILSNTRDMCFYIALSVTAIIKNLGE